MAEAAVRHIKSLIGLTTVVVVKAPGSIERSTGKAKRVRDLRPKGP
jgi:phenylacetate-CoA ligase